MVTPAKNLYHCFGCGAAAGLIDWVMKREGVSFRHAVELLQGGAAAWAASAAPAGPAKASTVRRLAPPVSFGEDDQALLDQVVGYYHETLKQTPRGAGLSGSAGAWCMAS